MIAVVDYGIGNLRSAEKALQHLGADARLTSDAREIGSAHAVVLPGVGAFGACMQALRDAGLEGVAKEAATDGRPFLGICIGMQMLFDGSDETPDVAGLGVVAGRITRLAVVGAASADRVEHVGDPQRFAARAPGCPIRRGCTSCTRTRPRPTTTRSSPRGASTAAGSRRRSKSGRCGRRSSTPRSRARSASGSCRTSSTPRTPPEMELYPSIDLRDGKVVRLHPRRLRRADDVQRRSGRGRARVRRGRRASGSTSSTSTPRATAARRTWRSSKRSARTSRRACRRAAACAASRTRPRGSRPASRASSSAARRSSSPSSSSSSRRCIPGRSRSGLDARGRDVAIHGWEQSTGADLVTLAQQFDRSGVAAIIVTEIGRDGTLSGPDLDTLDAVHDAVERR